MKTPKIQNHDSEIHQRRESLMKQKKECMCLYCQITRKWNERVRESYKEGFRDGIESCKPNKKLDKAIKEGLEL